MNMSPEYMAALHKFLYLSNDTNIERLKSVVATHLKYIPHKKLYRYRKYAILMIRLVWYVLHYPDVTDSLMIETAMQLLQE